MFSVGLRSDAKESMNKTTLADHITLRQPTDLPLPDQDACFVTIDRPLTHLLPTGTTGSRNGSSNCRISRGSCSTLRLSVDDTGSKPSGKMLFPARACRASGI